MHLVTCCIRDISMYFYWLRLEYSLFSLFLLRSHPRAELIYIWIHKDCLNEINRINSPFIEYCLFSNLHLIFAKCIYLGLAKSNVGDTEFSFKTIKKKFFFYRTIEKMKLYLSILFDPYLTSIKLIEIRAKLSSHEILLW